MTEIEPAIARHLHTEGYSPRVIAGALGLRRGLVWDAIKGRVPIAPAVERVIAEAAREKSGPGLGEGSNALTPKSVRGRGGNGSTPSFRSRVEYVADADRVARGLRYVLALMDAGGRDGGERQER